MVSPASSNRIFIQRKHPIKGILRASQSESGCGHTNQWGPHFQNVQRAEILRGTRRFEPFWPAITPTPVLFHTQAIIYRNQEIPKEREAGLGHLAPQAHSVLHQSISMLLSCTIPISFDVQTLSLSILLMLLIVEAVPWKQLWNCGCGNCLFLN